MLQTYQILIDSLTLTLRLYPFFLSKKEIKQENNINRFVKNLALTNSIQFQFKSKNKYMLHKIFFSHFKNGLSDDVYLMYPIFQGWNSEVQHQTF